MKKGKEEKARGSGGRKEQKGKKKRGNRRDRGKNKKELLYGTMETCTYRHMCEYTQNVCAKMRSILQVFRQ